MEFGKDCYTKVNLTVTALPGEIYDLKVVDLIDKEENRSFWNILQSSNSIQFWSM